MEYFVKEEGLDEGAQITRNKMSDVRVGKVTLVLLDKNPDRILPFKGAKFPLVSEYDYSSFLNQCSKERDFDNLPESIKSSVMKAEQIKVLTDEFKKYLLKKEISSDSFLDKNERINWILCMIGYSLIN